MMRIRQARSGWDIAPFPRPRPLRRTPALLLLLALGCGENTTAPNAEHAFFGPPGARTYQEGSVLYLERIDGGRKVRVGLSERWGGSVVEVSLNEVNFVNAFDAGREIQISLYDGQHRYDDCAGCKAVWGWNPVQAGDKHHNGSTVLEKRLDEDALYIKVQPNHWFPDNKGGGSGRPVPADVVFEQWISILPDYPTVVRLRYRITHLGDDSHSFTGQQEFPAVYVNREFDRFVHYSGPTPWSGGEVKTSTLPRLFVEPQLRVHTAEWWGAFVDEKGTGLTIFTPGSFPYMSSGVQGGSRGSQGSGAVYTHPYTPFAIAPRDTIAGDVYLIVGHHRQARQTIYQLVEKITTLDVAAPIGGLDAVGGGEAVGGTVTLSGWAYDNVGVTSVTLLADGAVVGSARLGQFRPEVRRLWTGAPSTTGFILLLDTTRFPNGTHQLVARVQDAAGNVNDLAATVEIRN